MNVSLKRNLISVLVCFLFVISSIPVSSESSNPEPDDYPNGWTHRPIMEQFTSLGCSPCMGIDPDVAKLWKEFREDPSEPVTFISFHQTNGGSSDDEFVSQESKDRYNYYSSTNAVKQNFHIGQVIREKENQFLPSTSSLNNTMSDIVGTYTFNFNGRKNKNKRGRLFKFIPYNG